MERLAAILMSLSLFSVPVSPGTTTGAGIALCGAATEVHAYTIAVEWNKRVFTRDEIAEITFTVTRPSPEEPGVASVPAEGVTVWTTVLTGRWPYPYGYGDQLTDSEGKAEVKVPLKLLKEPGRYDVSHNAERWTNQGGCPDIHEWGYLKESPGLTIRN